MLRRRSARPLLAVLFASALVAASCTDAGDDVQTESVDATTPSTEAGGDIDPGDDENDPTAADSGPGDPADAGADDPVATAEPPDLDGLPSLTELDPDTLTRTLDNGLRYLVRTNDNPGSKVDLRLAIDAGSVLEDEAQLGGAHYLEHMLFNGTEQFPKNELIDTLRSFGAAFGADVNAYTAFDETVYSLNIPNDPETIEVALDVLEQWLSFALIDPAEVDAERGIILDEWRVRDQTPNGRILDAVSRFFLDDTPYENRLPIGGEEAIEATTAEELRRFYEDWYRPDLASVIVVGDVDIDSVEQAIIDRFADVENPPDPIERPDPTIDPADEVRALVLDDPDLDEGFAFVTLPAEPVDGLTPEAEALLGLYQSIAFDTIATRLQNDALRGEAPFESASVGSTEFTRDAVAPEILVSLDGDEVEAGVQTILDEYERVLRYGFTPAEIERSVESFRSSFQQTFDGRNSRQDRSYADEYVRHVLEGEWYVTAEREFEFWTEALDRATAANVLFVFSDLVGQAAPHIVAAVPSSEREQVPTEARLIELAENAADREIEPRAAERTIGDRLMDRPTPVEVVERFQLSDETFTPVLDPTVVRFANGVTVALNQTQIVEGEVFLEARSPGGLAAVADGDVPDADAVRDVVGQSGVAEFDPVSLEAFLDDKQVSLVPFIDQFEEGLFGSAATSDLETYFQLIHLAMTEPRVDEIALERYLDDQLPRAEDPSIDADYAELKAQLDARYDDPRFLLPTPETLATVDADGILSVAEDRFGDAGDWTFSFSGDFDIEEGIELAAAYLGTLPSTDRVEATDYAEPPPPEGVVSTQVEAGEGLQANVSFLFTGGATSDRVDDVTARVVDQVIGNRLTDVVREELGDSYSPFGVVTLGGGETPQTEIYISVSTAPDQVQAVSDAVLSQLEELRADGPSQREFDNAVATVAEQLNFVNNNQINDEALDVLVDPAGNGDFDLFVFEFELIEQVSLDDVTAGLNAWTSADQYIEVRVVPRS